MIYDILEVFREEYKVRGDKLILDNYELKEGLYVKVAQNETLDFFFVKKKNREFIFTDINNTLNSEAYEWFKVRDYYSSYLNSNKAFYDKKIHNVNYLSLFVKLDSFISTDPKKQLDKDAIKYHYKALCDYQKFNKPQEKEILETFQTQLSDRERRKDIISKYRSLQKNLLQIIEIAQTQGVTNYIKIFFDTSVEQYQKESEIYYAIKIFNDITHSKTLKDEVYGLSDANMGLNAKKPYLEHKSRQLVSPFMILKEDALLTKKFFDWLKFQELQKKKPLDHNQEFFISRDYREKDLIIDYDYIPVVIDRLDKPITIKNHLLIKNDRMFIEDKIYNYLSHVEDLIHDVLYNRQLKNNYYGEVYNKLDHKFASFIYLTRDAMVNYFKKFDDRTFYQVIEKYATHLAIEHLIRGRFSLAGESLNIKFSLREHTKKGEKNMNIKVMQQTILDKVQDSNYEPLNKDEFFYLCGQVARYLISQSEAHKKNGDMLEPYLRSNSAKKLKKVIENEYFNYKHAISLGFVKFNNVMSLIMSFEEDEKLSSNMDSFLVGALSENIFYIKSTEEK